MKITKFEEEQFYILADPILSNDKVQLMKSYIQHGRITTYDHVLSVSKTAFALNKRWGWNVNEKSLVTACLLHDFYLYDWHDARIDVPLKEMHGFTHPFAACEMAIKEFDIDEDTQRAIQTHMWPLNITKIPKGKEAWLLCISDKMCALEETLFKR